MIRRFAPLCAVFVCACASSTDRTASDPAVVTSDVRNFVRAWTQLTPDDTTCSVLDSYLRDESPGMRAYRSKFDVSRRDICQAARRMPERARVMRSNWRR